MFGAGVGGLLPDGYDLKRCIVLAVVEQFTHLSIAIVISEKTEAQIETIAMNCDSLQYVPPNGQCEFSM